MSPDRCPYHEATRKEVADLGIAVAHLQEQRNAIESEAETMKEQMDKVCTSLEAVNATINRWTWTYALVVAGGGILAGVFTTLLGIAIEFRVPLAKLLGGL